MRSAQTPRLTSVQVDALSRLSMNRRSFMVRSMMTGLSFSAAAGFLAACSSPSSDGAAGEGGTKGMCHTIINIASLATGVEGFKFAWEALGQQALVQSYDADPQKALQQVELFSGLGVKANWGYLIADSLLDQYVSTLSRSKILYQNVGNPIPWTIPIADKYKGSYLTQVGASFSDEAYLAAKALFERAGGEGELIWLTGAKGTAGDTSRTTGVNFALKEFPKIKVAVSQPADWLQTKAQQLTEQLVPAHPNATMIMAQNDSIGIGAVAALQSLGKKNVMVAGVDGDPQFIKLIADGQNAVATSASRVDYQGVIIAVRFFDELMGAGDKWDPLECILRQDDVLVDTPESAQALLDLTTDAGGKLKLPYDVKAPSRHLHPDDWKVQTVFQALDPYFEWYVSIPSEKPSDFAWPAAYQEALNPAHAKQVNDEWVKRNDDVFAPVRAKAKYQGQVLGALVKAGLVPGFTPYTAPAGS